MPLYDEAPSPFGGDTCASRSADCACETDSCILCETSWLASHIRRTLMQPKQQTMRNSRVISNNPGTSESVQGSNLAIKTKSMDRSEPYADGASRPRAKWKPHYLAFLSLGMRMKWTLTGQRPRAAQSLPSCSRDDCSALVPRFALPPL